MQSFLLFSINLLLWLFKYNSKGYWVLIKSGIQLQIYLLVHVNREFWWTDNIKLNGSTKVSESVWDENNSRITEVTEAIRPEEVRIIYIYLIIFII